MSFGQLLVTRSVSSAVGVITIAVYLVLMPIMVFFFLKDKERIVGWSASVCPMIDACSNGCGMTSIFKSTIMCAARLSRS